MLDLVPCLDGGAATAMRLVAARRAERNAHPPSRGTGRPARPGQTFAARSRKLLASTLLRPLIVALGPSQPAAGGPSEGQAVEAPSFEVDPFWQQPLPVTGSWARRIGVGVDAREQVFIVHRQQTLNARTEVLSAEAAKGSECCVAAPPVLEFSIRRASW